MVSFNVYIQSLHCINCARIKRSHGAPKKKPVEMITTKRRREREKGKESAFCQNFFLAFASQLRIFGFRRIRK